MRAIDTQRGFSLVEILVGMAIGLIGCVIIFQVFAVNEGYKRSTTSGADAQVAGALALYALEREIKMAGFGVSDRMALGCNMLGYTSTRAPTGYSLTMAPVQIHAGATADDPDIISVNYGNAIEFGPGYGLAGASMAPGSPFRIENRGGIRFYDFLLAVQPAQPNCSLVNAVNLPLAQKPTGGIAGVACGGNNTSDSVEICSSIAKTDSDGVSRFYNPGGGLSGAPTYTVQPGTNNTRYYSLGAEPVFAVFRIVNNALSVCNMRFADCGDLAAANWTPIAENVVHMKAEYGMDTDDDGVVDAYSAQLCHDNDAYTPAQPAPSVAGWNDNLGDAWLASSDSDGNGLHDTWAAVAPSAHDWSRVAAIRLAIVVRGTQFDKEDVTTNPVSLWKATGKIADRCNGTDFDVNESPVTEGAQYNAPDLKYRYRVFETIIPLRNSIWMPS